MFSVLHRIYACRQRNFNLHKIPHTLEKLAEIIRHRFVNPKATLRELFSRIVFNILCGNTDDHARNHAAFWDGHQLALTPAYDICPQSRSSQQASQAMLIRGAERTSQVGVCIAAASVFLLSEIAHSIARDIKKLGGIITADDLKRYHARIVDPITADYRGAQLALAPNLTAGPSMLQTINHLRGVSFKAGKPDADAYLERQRRMFRPRVRG